MSDPVFPTVSHPTVHGEKKMVTKLCQQKLKQCRVLVNETNKQALPLILGFF